MSKSRWNHSVCDLCYDRISDGTSPHRMLDPKVEKCCVCRDETKSGIYVRIDPSKTLCRGVHPDDETERLEKKPVVP